MLHQDYLEHQRDLIKRNISIFTTTDLILRSVQIIHVKVIGSTPR